MLRVKPQIDWQNYSLARKLLYVPHFKLLCYCKQRKYYENATVVYIARLKINIWQSNNDVFFWCTSTYMLEVRRAHIVLYDYYANTIHMREPVGLTSIRIDIKDWFCLAHFSWPEIFQSSKVTSNFRNFWQFWSRIPELCRHFHAHLARKNAGRNPSFSSASFYNLRFVLA